LQPVSERAAPYNSRNEPELVVPDRWKRSPDQACGGADPDSPWCDLGADNRGRQRSNRSDTRADDGGADAQADGSEHRECAYRSSGDEDRPSEDLGGDDDGGKAEAVSGGGEAAFGSGFGWFTSGEWPK